MCQHKQILIVEDDADDRELLLDAVRSLNTEVELVMKENGLEALNYLATVRESPGATPCLVVLDLNMPYLDGRATFEHIRADASLAGLPVIIFTSSLSPHERDHFTSLGAGFISKPTDYRQLHEIAARMLAVCEQG